MLIRLFRVKEFKILRVLGGDSTELAEVIALQTLAWQNLLTLSGIPFYL